jgi:hypothetical protein
VVERGDDSAWIGRAKVADALICPFACAIDTDTSLTWSNGGEDTCPTHAASTARRGSDGLIDTILLAGRLSRGLLAPQSFPDVDSRVTLIQGHGVGRSWERRLPRESFPFFFWS